MEKFKPQPQLNIDIEDYVDAPYYSVLQTLPKQLVLLHLTHIEKNKLSDEEAEAYLTHVVEKRSEAVRTSSISDERFEQELAVGKEELLTSLETSVYHNPDNYLGEGTTARVKLYEAQMKDGELPLAIKYIVSPTEKTLTAEREHDVIKEVERMRTIEAAEVQHERRSKYIRVPHPYLHHKTDKLQCYGMEVIDGVNIQQILDGHLPQELKEKLRSSRLTDVPPEELDGYIERFFHTMHEYCLHGDVKPRNIMVSSDGVLYVIDFGQSVLKQNISDTDLERFENLKEREIKMAQLAVHRLFREVFQSKREDKEESPS